MIYLILTASLINRHGQDIERTNQYLSSIAITLQHLPESIQPIIVENNGARATCLDYFVHNGKPVPVIYTHHNEQRFPSKGINELMDLQAVIQQYPIAPMDMIIKLTGRYHPTSSLFFEEVIREEKNYDAFVKFFNVCSLQYEENDCVLGCYAIRAYHLLLWKPLSIMNYPSAEIAFARYVRASAPFREITTLHVHCIFAEENRILDV